MMEIEKILNTVSEEVTRVCSSVDSAEMKRLADEIEEAGNIFIYGNGRSGLVGKMIAMRLMHSGYDVFVVGETITPALQENDLLVVLSGSGKSRTISNMIEKVGTIGGRTGLVTATEDADIRESFDTVLTIKASTKHNDIPTIQPLGNQFDQSMHLILDALIIHLNEISKKDKEKLKSRHFNLE